MLAITAKEVFRAWPAILVVLAGGLALDLTALWRQRHRRSRAVALGVVGFLVAMVLIGFSSMLLSLADGW